MRKHLSLWGLLLLLPAFCLASEWNSYVVNFSKALYGNGSQTWQIKSFSNRWMFFANQNGLVQFDGTSWNMYSIHNGTSLRSVLPSSSLKRVYVGGINEFGYFKPNADGKMIYTCLSDKLKGKQVFGGNIWNIFENEGVLYFQGDGMILKYLNGKFQFINAHEKIETSALIDGVLYVATVHCIYMLVGNTLFPLQGAVNLFNKRIKSILPYAGKILIVTAYDGMYCYDGRKAVPFATGISDFIKQNEVFCAAISGNNLAVGSVRSGLAVYNLALRTSKYFNETNGMQNNTVLSVSFDNSGNLWAGLDSRGVDYILLNSSLTNLYTYPYSFGTGYAALLNNNILYLGTNRGLYYTPVPVVTAGRVPPLRAIQGGSGQVWSLSRVGNEIFCLHDRGVFTLQGTSMKKVTYITGAWACQTVLGTSNMAYVGVYDGIYLIRKVGATWNVAQKISGITTSCRSFAQEAKNVLWVANASTVFRIVLDSQLKRVLHTESFQLRQYHIDKNTKVVRVGNTILISSPRGIFQYDARHHTIRPWHFTKDIQGQSVACVAQLNNLIIALTSEHIGQYDPRTGHVKNTCFEAPSLPLVPEAETIVPISNNTMIIPNDNGFALFQSSPMERKDYYDKMLHIRNVYLTYPKDSLIYTDNFLSLKNRPLISFSHNSVRFEYGISSFVNIEGVVYQYRLNKKEWSEYTTNRNKEYSNLHEGDYTFQVRAFFPNGYVSNDSFSFIISPPWYRTGWAYFVYFIFFTLTVWCIYRWDDIRVAQKKQQAVIEKNKQMERMEREYAEDKAQKEHQIVELEKEKLEYELQHKSQEMANLMINFVRKNEILTEIRTDLFKVLSTLKGGDAKESKQQLMLVRNKIDFNIQGDEVLKRIEDQFDLVHNNFMKTLRGKYPDLSNNERMMCAYLKMNLSTKEIAPLLNISVRGVETIRYRLRKKFNLERDESLTDYINHI